MESVPKKKAKVKSKKKAKPRKKILVIVESPAKAKTINRYLGNSYIVEASMGHVIDLPKSRIAVNVEKDFEPDYITVRGRGKILNRIKKLSGQASAVYLAADEDREGEAISWHLYNEIKKKYPDLAVSRIILHEITKPAVQEAIASPREIDLSKVNAQRARRILDRLVGYNISPILWDKVKKGLSAGRVQSVALKLVCEREEVIQGFKPEEYWNVDGIFKKEKKEFPARLIKINDEKVSLKSKDDVDEIISDCGKDSFVCEKIETKTRTRKPLAPFTTSKMQQDAANKLGFTSDKIMRIAQQLYEGVELEQGATGLISYMRTDSVRISDVAKQQALEFIKSEYGENFIPDTSNEYKNRKGIQDAHEAIRPTDVFNTPDKVKKYLSRDQYRLYKLIWSRFVGSRMKPAVFDQVVVDIKNGNALFRANGSKVKFKGFLKVYGKMEDDEKSTDLPQLNQNDKVELVDELNPTQHFTQPAPRFNDASIVKILEESGIGRPSTYAPTIFTLIKRYYVTRQGRQLIPTELGILVNSIMVEHFTNLVDPAFTAQMEEQLDQVEEEKLEWVNLLRTFYDGFSPVLEKAAVNIKDVKNIFDEETEYNCKECGSVMLKKLGRYGFFLACSTFPDCRYTEPLPLAHCPNDGCDGKIVAKRGKKGRVFYGCSNYKADDTGCGFVSWDKPVKKKCPECSGLLVEKNTKDMGYHYSCINENCEYTEKMEG